jgi:DNA modification methylase
MNTIVHSQCTTQIWLLSSNDIDGSAITLTQALQEWEEQKLRCDSMMKENYPNIVVIALDATWKYANEMDRANVQYGGYPNQCLRRVRLTSVDFHHPLFQQQSLPSQPTGDVIARPKYNRFTIRTPPRSKTTAANNTDTADTSCKNLVHLSTAECLAYVLTRIEQNDNIYHSVMKPLDLMVRQWQSHYKNSSSSSS